MNRKGGKSISWLTVNCFILFMLFAFLSFYFNVSGVVRQVLWVLLFLINLKNIRPSCQIDYIVVFYFVAAFLSLTGNMVIPYPTENFITVFIYSYIPVIFYFVGKNSNEVYPQFFYKSNFGALFLFVIGFYFLLFPTDVYIEKTLTALNQHNAYTEDTMEYARFASFMDSYHTSNIGICSLCFGFGLLKYSSSMSDKSKSFFKYLSYIFVIAAIIAVLLARQRVAIYIGIIILGYYLLIGSKKNRLSSVLLISLLFIAAANFVIESFDNLFIEQITGLFSSEASSTLVSSRSSQWQNAFNGFAMEPLLGLGIGSGGHVALATGQSHPIVTDGSYFKILLEGGIVSFIPFMIILVSSIIKGFKQRDRYYVEAPLLFFFTCSMIGANIIDMPYIIMFMWYIIGRINSNNKLIVSYGK